MLTACGGGGGSGSGGENSAPVFSAPTPVTALEDQAFSLALSATDADGDTLTYSATGLPEWLSINASTGLLSGTPERQDVGITQGITLTVSDGRASANTSLDLEVIQTETLTVFGSVSNVDLPNAEISVSFVVPQFAAPQNNKSQLTTKRGFSQKNKLTTQNSTSEKIVDTTITTSSDENGNFQFDVLLISGEFTGEELVEITARGVGDQDNIELLSQVGDIDFLLESAGDDFQLTVDELSRINISPLSTALALRARDRNNNVLSRTWDEIQQLENSLNAQQILQLADSISLFISNNANFVNGDTLLDAFISNQENSEVNTNAIYAFNEFIGDNGQLLPELADQLQTITESGNNYIPFSEQNIVPLLNRPLLFANEFVLGTYQDIFTPALEFSSNGTGNFYDNFRRSLYNRSITWEKREDGVLIINGVDTFVDDTLDTPMTYRNNLDLDEEVENFLAENGLIGTIINPETTREVIELRLVSVSESSIIIDVNHRITFNLDDVLTGLGYTGTLPEYTVTAALFGSRTVLNSRFEFTSETFSGENWVVPAQQNFGEPLGGISGIRHLSQDLYTFNTNGSTSIGLLSDESAQWEVVDGALQFTTASNTLTLTPLIETQDGIYVISERLTSDGVRNVSAGFITRQIEGNLDQFTQDFVLPELSAEQGLFWATNVEFFSSPADFEDDGSRVFTGLTGFGFRAGNENLVDRISAVPSTQSEIDDCIAFVGRSCFEVLDTNSFTFEGRRVTITEVNELGNGRFRSRVWDVLNYDPDLGRAVVLERVFFDVPGIDGNVLIDPRVTVLELIDLSEEYIEEYLAEPTIFN
ncbi:putative Ig domain-containing protein [Sessilibacter sp. MAH4]